MIDIFVNGECRQVDKALSVAAALEQWGFERARVAVAINSEFVSRADYGDRHFAADDCVDIVAPVAGG